MGIPEDENLTNVEAIHNTVANVRRIWVSGMARETGLPVSAFEASFEMIYGLGHVLGRAEGIVGSAEALNKGLHEWLTRRDRGGPPDEAA
jgi:hypothetical protein